MFVFRQDEFKESKVAIEKLSKLGLHTIGKNHSKLSCTKIYRMIFFKYLALNYSETTPFIKKYKVIHNFEWYFFRKQ